jgi:exosortase/archaeosortase family protein
MTPLVGNTVPAGRRRGGRRRVSGKPAGRMLTARIAASAAVAALSLAAIRENMDFRIFEAWLAGHVIGLVTSVRAGAVPGAPIVWFASSPHRDLAMYITPDCTVATLTIPFLVGTAWMIWHHSQLARPAAALAIAVILLVALNQLRLLTIACLVLAMGVSSGFYWGHTMVGSLITIFGVVLVFCAYAFVAVGRRGTLRRRRPAAWHAVAR